MRRNEPVLFRNLRHITNVYYYDNCIQTQSNFGKIRLFSIGEYFCRAAAISSLSQPANLAATWRSVDSLATHPSEVIFITNAVSVSVVIVSESISTVRLSS